MVDWLSLLKKWRLEREEERGWRKTASRVLHYTYPKWARPSKESLTETRFPLPNPLPTCFSLLFIYLIIYYLFDNLFNILSVSNSWSSSSMAPSHWRHPSLLCPL